MAHDELIEAMARAIYERVNGYGCRAWQRIDHKAAYRDQATAALAALEAAGCVVAPKEPTLNMVEAIQRESVDYPLSAAGARALVISALAAAPFAKEPA